MATTRLKHDDPPHIEGGNTTPERYMLGAGSSAASEIATSIDSTCLAALIAFFRLLDKWDQEVRSNEKMQ